MRLTQILTLSFCTVAMTACVTKGTNPDDPYEPINRRIYKFNSGFDKVFLKPPAQVYKAVIPARVRAGVNNVYNNINMLPSIANDILQADFNYAIKDTWRFIINSTFGIGGIFDAASRCQLPPHSNDLGLTFAKWGDKHSPYVMIPFLGPSTVRDGMAMMFDYALFTPYPYIRSDAFLYSVLAFRYVDLRAQMLDSERLMDDAIDKYAFMRDAYLQHRNYLINGSTQQDQGSLYVDENEDTSSKQSTTAPEIPQPARSPFPMTTASNASHRPSST